MNIFLFKHVKDLTYQNLTLVSYIKAVFTVV